MGELKTRLRTFINHKYTDLTISLMIIVSVLLLLLEYSKMFDRQMTDWFMLVGDGFTVIFIFELSIRYYVAKNKRRFFSKYWLDIIAVIPWMRSLRGFRALRLLRLFRAGALLSRSLSIFKLVFIKGRSDTVVVFATLVIIVLTAGFIFHFHEPPDSGYNDMEQSLWWSLFSLIAGEPIGQTPLSTLGKVIMVIVMLGGLTVFAMFTGLVTAVMVRRMNSELEVKAMEIEDLSGHIIICGWNRMGTQLFSEFRTDPDLSRLPVVVVAQFGELDILDIAGAHRDLVYPLNGDPTRVEMLEKAGTKKATYAILLADTLTKREDQDRDARTLLTALTLEKMNPEIYTVAELLSSESTNHLRMAGVEEVAVRGEITSNMLATCLRNRGLMSMVHEVFTSSFGSQFYKCRPPQDLAGEPFSVVMAELKDRYDILVVGIDKGDDAHSEVETNPPKDTVVEAGHKLVIIGNEPPSF